MTACRHGFDPETTLPKHLRDQFSTCPSCDYEDRLPWPVRFVAQHPTWGPWLTVFGLVLSVIAVIMSAGVLERWW